MVVKRTNRNGNIYAGHMKTALTFFFQFCFHLEFCFPLSLSLSLSLSLPKNRLLIIVHRDCQHLRVIV